MLHYMKMYMSYTYIFHIHIYMLTEYNSFNRSCISSSNIYNQGIRLGFCTRGVYFQWEKQTINIKTFQIVVRTLRKNQAVQRTLCKMQNHKFIRESKWTTLEFSFNLLLLKFFFFLILLDKKLSDFQRYVWQKKL